jgi:ATP-dependent exoDNAse (exonuclease V) beta subunit
LIEMPTTIINASAGSGKTYRLAVAYLQALLQPLPDGGQTSPQHVLATTFTRAAASEILERVLRRLALAVVSDGERQRLLAEVHRPGLGREELARLLESVCQVLPQLQIGTIDALFARIVRVMGLDLAFPPAWNVADDTQAAELALEATDRILRGPDVKQSREQWRRYSRFKSGIRVRAALVDLLEETRFLLIDAPVPPDNPDLAEPLRLMAEEVLQFRRALDAFDGLPLTKTGTANKNWVHDLERTKSLFQGEPFLVDLLANTLLRASGQEGAKHRGEALPAGLREILGPLMIRARDDLRRLHEARLPALAALARTYHGLRREVAYAVATYTFREVEAAVWTLPPHLSTEDLYFRLDARIQHLLLDEFQDTSLTQFRFLWPIITEVRSHGRLFFAVGDVKQSIYGWRGADRRLLGHLPDWLDPENRDPHLAHEQLNDNRRSSPAVLQAIDRIFERLDEAECLQPEAYDKKEQRRVSARKSAASSFIHDYQAHIPAGENRHLAGCVRLLITNPGGFPDEAEEYPDEIETILRAVEQHRHEDPEREIAILCRRRRWIPTIIAGLRQRGVEASGEGGNPVADSAAVEMVLSMLTWLDHPGHLLARGHVELGGMAAVFGFEGSARDDSLPKRFSVPLMRRGLAAVISDWVRHESFLPRCTLHDQVRCEQLVELARLWDAAGGGRLSRFVEKARLQRVENPASSQVRVMTIHGSKGLEFKAVILADLESASGGGGEGPPLTVAMTAPDAPPEVRLLPNDDEAELLGLEESYARHQQNRFEEDLSVLYVALTRAKSFLDVVAPAADKPRASLSGIILERWKHREAGEYLIEEFSGKPETRALTTVETMGPDEGVWEAADNLGIPNLKPVPGRMAEMTPSGQEGSGIVKLGLVLNTGNVPALERGTAVHALLSRIEWIEQLPNREAWIRSIPDREAGYEACRTAALELFPRLRDPKDKLTRLFDPKTWLDCWRADGVTRLEAWRERRFAVVAGRDLMNGTFDRVVLGWNAAGKLVRAAILDFKTDRLADDKEREERRLFYQPQLDAYAGALSRLTGLPAESIQTELVWID